MKIGAGDFTFYVKNGFLIEDGKLTRPIKDVNIIGNGPKVLEKIDMVADDLEHRRGRLDVRQGRAERAGVAGHAHGARLVDHRRREGQKKS